VSNIIEESIRENRTIIRDAGEWYAQVTEAERVAMVEEFPSCIRLGQAVAFNLLPGLARLCVIKAFQQQADQNQPLNYYWYAAANREAKGSK
jgi:hypothetical protein